jgi:hypothetical protein
MLTLFERWAAHVIGLSPFGVVVLAHSIAATISAPTPDPLNSSMTGIILAWLFV